MQYLNYVPDLKTKGKEGVTSFKILDFRDGEQWHIKLNLYVLKMSSGAEGNKENEFRL